MDGGVVSIWRVLGGIGAAVALMVPASSSAGIGSFVDASATHLPAVDTRSSDVQLADIDGDTDLDAYFAGSGTLLVNDCGAVFADATLERIGTPPSAEAARFVDLDRDGALDLVLAVLGQNRLYLNDGSGYFLDATAIHLPVDTAATKAIGVGDVDGDGLIDLYFANGQGQADHLLMNTGDARFWNESAIRLPQLSDFTSGVELVDLQGDGDLDIVLATEACAPDRALINDGEGVFDEQSLIRIGMGMQGTWSQGIAAGDFDGDGDRDLYVPEGSPNCHGEDLLLLQEREYFRKAGESHLPREVGLNSRMAVPVDLDGDGDLDIVVPQPPYLLLLQNDSYGQFTRSLVGQTLPLGGVAMHAAAADLDQDGDIDLLVSYLDAPASLLLNGEGVIQGGPAEISPVGREPLRVSWRGRDGLHLKWEEPRTQPWVYNVYQGVIGDAGSHRPVTGYCHLPPQQPGAVGDGWLPVPTGGGNLYFLVTASNCAGEGTAGPGAGGEPRTGRGICGAY